MTNSPANPGTKAPRIIIAPDSYKGTATAAQAAQYLGEGVLEVMPDASITLAPMADGGEGTSAVFGGQVITLPTTNAAGRLTEASYTFEQHSHTAYIDIAAASGLPAVADNPVPTTGDTYGTGVLIADAVTRGATRIVLGLGGSATTDAGSGILIALGAVPRNKEGYALRTGGADLINLDYIDTAELNIPAAAVEWILLTDVDAPATGPQGAATVFGPQKGATAKDIALLDASLHHAYTQLEIDGTKPGMGAAGGIAIGLTWLSTLMHGTDAHIHILPGAPLIANSNGIADALPETDLLISGEGRLDAQSFTGKVVGTLHDLAKAHNVDLAVAAGVIEEGIPGDFLAVEMIKSSDVAAQLRDAGRRIAEAYLAQN
ncbi:glycerate kinase [Corynebacterium crudilactis]|uniref:Glycerate kinase n=1 Tax=Corynebacterium crudilactis TaxID=1652495 RepID=A0A172QUG7_9CORY|nr:glycerate kinase [Corynebacterium crudilactis]ANE04343.1 glycerate kinase [Corynebacterium crudilactis]